MKLTVLIMAAGKGTRMSSGLPKVLHPVCGRPMVRWPLEAAREAGAEKVVVICSPASGVEAALPGYAQVVTQEQQLGTGDAVRCAAGEIDPGDNVIVLSGDHPLITGEVISELIEVHGREGADATVATTVLDDPGSYGRIVRGGDGSFERIVEAKVEGDATPGQLAISEINTGTYCFKGERLLSGLQKLGKDNAQNEYYIGDVFAMIVGDGGRVVAHCLQDSDFAIGINSRADLARVQQIAQRRINHAHMLAGVTLTDSASTYIDAGVTIAADTTIEPNTYLKGETRIGSGCTVGPSTTVIDSDIGDGAGVTHSYLMGCRVAGGCKVGPFTYLRPDAQLGEGAKAGAFVEIKNSQIGTGTKVPHLSYVGDADIGDDTNIGAGTITANYDGREKHRTVIGSNVKTGVDTAFVAPVCVGDGAYTGAGSVITEDVPEGALAIGREKQKNIDGYAERRGDKSPK